MKHPHLHVFIDMYALVGETPHTKTNPEALRTAADEAIRTMDQTLREVTKGDAKS